MSCILVFTPRKSTRRTFKLYIYITSDLTNELWRNCFACNTGYCEYEQTLNLLIEKRKKISDPGFKS